MNMLITKTGTDSCPICGHLVDSATSFGPNAKKPVPGDVTICILCAGILRFADDMALVAMSNDEIAMTLTPGMRFRTLEAVKQIAVQRGQDLFNEAMDILRTKGRIPTPEDIQRTMDEIQDARGYRLPIRYDIQIPKPSDQ